MTHRVTVARAAARQVRAVARCRRLAAALDRLAGQLAAHALAHLPADPRPWDAYPAAEAVRAAVARAGPPLALMLRLGLAGLATWGHRASARLLTGAARKGSRENKFPDVTNPHVGQLLGKCWATVGHHGRITEDDGDPYDGFVIAPPPAALIRALVGPAPDRLTTLVPAQRAAAVVYAGVAAGHDRRRIAADLTPVLDGVGTAARRVARTEGLRVATASQLAASESIPGLVAGYQVLCVLDDRTRPAHRERNGLIYWRHPKPGQLGFAQMPHPPIEADGTVAHNCRCTLAPVFATAGDLSPVPDPDEMGRLFAGMAAPDRETLVGVERYDLARRLLGGREPEWRDFIQRGESEDLLPLSVLAALWKALAG